MFEICLATRSAAFFMRKALPCAFFNFCSCICSFSATKTIITTSNWWLALPLEESITGLTPLRGTESLTPHYNHRQPLTRGCLFCLHAVEINLKLFYSKGKRGHFASCPLSPFGILCRVAIINCSPLWLKICHRHIFLTRRAPKTLRLVVQNLS